MARKKTQEELEAQNNPVTEPEVQDTPATEPEVQDTPATEPEVETVEVKENNSAKNENTESHVMNGEIPKSAARLLKLFANYEELYVSESGSVYTTDTKLAIRGNAILYKNPYFNNSKINN